MNDVMEKYVIQVKIIVISANEFQGNPVIYNFHVKI